MKRSFSPARRMIVAAALTVMTGAAGVLAACSNHDETPTASAPSRPTAPDEAGLPSEAGGPADAGAPSEAGGPNGADAGTLYGRLGGNAGITALATAIIDAELMDPVIASYFGASDPKPVLKATREQDEACLVLQLGQASGGPEVYPGQVVGGFTCRSMMQAHAGLAIDGAVFDRFLAIAAGVLKAAHVADADINTLGLALIGLKSQIVSVQTLGDDAGPFSGP